MFEFVINIHAEHCNIICYVQRSEWLRMFAQRMIREGYDYTIGIAYSLAGGIRDGELG